MPEPFQQLPYAEIPALPRRPHGYERTEPHTVSMESQPFGRIRVHYRTLGEGPPLLLMHGLMTTSYSWRYVFEPLAARFRVYAPDMPGCGESEKPLDRSYSAPALATWIGEFQDAVGISGCVAVGNSLGGYLCMRRALEAPESFARLVNEHSPGVPELRLRALHTLLKLPGLKQILAAVVRQDPLRWAHRNVHYYDETLKSLEEAGAYGAPLATREGAGAFVRYLAETLAPADLAAFVADLEQRRAAGQPFPVPLQLIYARRDPMVPPEIGRRLHQLIPDAEMVWLSRTSHFPHIDSPDRVVPLLLSFLER